MERWNWCAPSAGALAEDDSPAVCRAGWVYLVAAHLGTLCLIAMFALWRHTTGSFALETAQAIPAGQPFPDSARFSGGHPFPQLQYPGRLVH